MSDRWSDSDLIDHETRNPEAYARSKAATPTWPCPDAQAEVEARAGSPSPRKPRAHPERDLEKACSDLLQLDGWRLLKTDPGSDASVIQAIRRAIMGCPALNHVRELIFSILKKCTRGKGFGEIGMADCLYIRYQDPADFEEMEKKRWAELLWIEWKSSKGHASAAQRLWIAAERARGALVWIAGSNPNTGADFPASVDGFLAHYRGSGLMRRKL